MQTYRGSCHCGRVSFEFESEAITDGCRCNCSICVRKGATMSRRYYAPSDFKELSGKAELTLYHFGDVMVNHYFCKHCGVYPFHDAIQKPGHYRINLGCVEGVDIFALEIVLLDGRSF